MTAKDFTDIALRQSAIDSNCDVSDFTCGKNKTVISKADDRARKYLKLPYIADITTCDVDDSEEDTYPDDLFLKGYSDILSNGGYKYSDDTKYEYDVDTLFGRYGEEA